MPNWCDTTYYITGENKTLLYKFYLDASMAITKGGLGDKDADADEDWLGNIYIKAGCPRTEKGFAEDWIFCRGHVNYLQMIERDGKSIGGVEIQCETAWEPMDESFQTMLDKYYPGLKCLCFAEEPGSEIYYNSDKEHEFFHVKWKIDAYGDDYSEYFDYDEEGKFLREIERLTGLKYTSADKIQKDKLLLGFTKTLLEEGHSKSEVEDFYIYVYEFESY